MRALDRAGAAACLLPVVLLAMPMLSPVLGSGQVQSETAGQQHESPEITPFINGAIAGEKLYVAKLRHYSPRVETYVQFYERDTLLGDVPKNDAYFLGRLMVATDAQEVSFLPDSILNRIRLRPEMLSKHLDLNEFAVEPLTVDRKHFDRDHYTFTPFRWEYLGDVRCLAITVQPRRRKQGEPFEGRIWVNDRDHAIVRLNGTRLNPPHGHFYAHFDCWRANLQPGMWLPIYIFSHESDLGRRLTYNAETRFWGYNVAEGSAQPAHTSQNSDSPLRKSPKKAGMSNDESLRRLNIAAEHNVVKRLERARLIAPAGPVDRVLLTVVNNLIITNHLDKLPPVDCRVLLTSPLESFSQAYTIVLSRGLIDVLPDEASLAMILAHELAHISLGHAVNSHYAQEEGMDAPDEKLIASMALARSRRDEIAADAKGVEFFEHSPYKDDLGQAGLFLKLAASTAESAPHLFGGYLGNGLSEGSGGLIRMSSLMTGAPALRPQNVDQIAALPLGSRIQVNPWDGSIAFANRPAVPLIAASEKMPFQLTPVIPHLKFYGEPIHLQVWNRSK